jgi:hypothetical protein
VSRRPRLPKPRRRLALAGVTAALAAAGLAAVANAAYVDDHDVELISRTPATPASPSEIGNAPSELLSVSADGRYVLFSSSGDTFPRGDVAPDERTSATLYRKDRQTGAVDLVARPTRLTVPPPPAPQQKSFCGVSIVAGDMSADGRYVVFATQERLDPDDGNWLTDVYVRDMTKTIRPNPPAGEERDEDGAWTLVSALDGGETPASYRPSPGATGPLPADCDDTTSPPAAGLGAALPSGSSELISADGRRVIFSLHVRNSNLPSGTETTSRFNLFWRDLDQQTTRAVTRDKNDSSQAGQPVTMANLISTASLSGDGTKVAWTGSAGSAQARIEQQEYGSQGSEANFRHTFWRDMSASGTAPTRRPASLIDYDDPACDADALAALTWDQVRNSNLEGPCFGYVAHAQIEFAGARDLALSRDGLTLAWTMTGVPRPSPGGGASGADVWVTSMVSEVSRKEGTEIVTRVPGASDGAPGTFEAVDGLALSADARLLAFRTKRIDFSSLTEPSPVGPMPALTGNGNVFRVTLAANRTPELLELVTRGKDACEDPVEMNGGHGTGVRYSADGSVIAFDSDATNLVPGAGARPQPGGGLDAKTDVFVSRPRTGPVGPGPCDPPPPDGGGGDTGAGGDFGGGTGGGTTTPPPPGANPPATPARFRLGAATVDRKGVVRLRLTVPRPGTLQGVASAPNANASQRRKRRVTYGRGRATARRAGAVTLVVKPTNAGRKLMRRRRTLPVRIKVTYRPSGGRPITSTKRVTVRAARNSRSGRRGR